MPFSCYVSIEGTKQGKFKGEQSFSKLGTGKITVLRLNYSVDMPHDLATGKPSGKRQHGVVRFTKEVGAASPQLFQALVQNEALKTVLFEFVRTTASGEEQVYFTIKLTGGNVAHVATSFDATIRGTRVDGHQLQEVDLTFDKIEVEETTAKTTSSDNWDIQ
jgi:type VI secretion system secreted protein Hcp